MTSQRLTLFIFLAVAGASLSACASPGGATPAGCDGHHRRPANPNGSVLDGAPTPAAAPAASTPPHASRRPCGGDAA